MAGTIWEFFGFKTSEPSEISKQYIDNEKCPILEDKCQKTFNDGIISGVCSIKPMTSQPVICCPVRLYDKEYQVLKDISKLAFQNNYKLVEGRKAVDFAKNSNSECVAVFGKKWGGELRLPKRVGAGSYYVDWILAKLDANGEMIEFVAVEVQTIDTTGNYRNGYSALKNSGSIEKTTAGLNWENVSKRILPQLIYKGSVLQREEMCKKGLFFVCPTPVYERVMQRLGGQERLPKYTLQPAAITFMGYEYTKGVSPKHPNLAPIENDIVHTTTVFQIQEAFSRFSLPDANVYRDAILEALGY